MSTPTPQAYLLTWTCYGTWLHGDERGSVDEEHNRYGESWARPSEARREWEAAQLKNPPVILEDAMRRTVDAAIKDHCAVRAWELHAINVRTNHAHAVVAARGTAPGVIVGQFKAWATRRLRESGLVSPEIEIWTARSSTRYLWEPYHVHRAIEYVLHEQDGPGRRKRE